MKNFIGFVIAVIVLVYLFSGNSDIVSQDKYTLDQFNSIQMGMSYSQVVQIVGEEGTVLSDVKVMDIRTTMYSWQGDGVANFNVTFQNGAVISKAQFGLK